MVDGENTINILPIISGMSRSKWRRRDPACGKDCGTAHQRRLDCLKAKGAMEVWAKGAVVHSVLDP